MALPKLVYGLPRGNLLRTAQSITLTDGVLEDGYGLEKLYDSIWADPCRCTTNDFQFVAEWATPVLPALAALLNSNLNVAGILEGNDDPNDWTSPAVTAQAFGIPAVNGRGFFTSPHLDLSALTAQLAWRFTVSANARLVTIGELYLGARYELEGYFFPGVRFGLRGNTAVNRTHQNLPLTYELSPGGRSLEGSLIVSGTQITQLEKLVDRARYRARQFPLVPRSDNNDAWMVRIATDDLASTPRNSDTDEIALPVEADSRGFPWVEPDDEDS